MKLSLLAVMLGPLFVCVGGVRNVQIASPLMALTIWDDADEKPETHRSRFLPRLRAGLSAEAIAAQDFTGSKSRKPSLSLDKPDWAKQVAGSEQRERTAQTKAMERAYDMAVAKHDAIQNKSKTAKKQSSNTHQFVGVVNPKSTENPITWYARQKPAHAKWSVRLIHVNKEAVIKDLFNRGKIDLFARYENSGQIAESGQSAVTVNYSVRERSWKTLWNFSPKHFFSDSSGMYWRERRLRPGLYTDGQSVYATSYRYRDGRNGIRALSSLQNYFKRNGSKQQQIEEKIRKGVPEIVLEND